MTHLESMARNKLVREDFKRGMACCELAFKYDISLSTTQKIVRPARPPKPVVDRAEVVRLLREGRGNKAIARQVGTHHVAVRKIRQEEGIRSWRELQG